MSEEDAGETGGDREGERGGVVKGDDGWEVNGDERGSVSRGGGFNLWDLVRGASVGVCRFCNSEGQLLVVYFVDDVEWEFESNMQRKFAGSLSMEVKTGRNSSRWRFKMLAMESSTPHDGGSCVTVFSC
jgi:hypothetical protein